MKFSGNNVLVTGASRGIGAEIAKSLAAFGLKVWVNYRSGEAEANAVKSAIEAEGGKAEVIGFDVSNEEAFVAAIKEIIEADGELAYLVNNAGITKDKLAMRMKTEEFMDVINANLTSTFIGCREALKVMGKKRFGSVVNIATVACDLCGLDARYPIEGDDGRRFCCAACVEVDRLLRSTPIEVPSESTAEADVDTVTDLMRFHEWKLTQARQT